MSLSKEYRRAYSNAGFCSSRSGCIPPPRCSPWLIHCPTQSYIHSISVVEHFLSSFARETAYKKAQPRSLWVNNLHRTLGAPAAAAAGG